MFCAVTAVRALVPCTRMRGEGLEVGLDAGARRPESEPAMVSADVGVVSRHEATIGVVPG